ncbi:OmpA family protein, partial [Poseidonibacter ostreae]|jgi:OmpA-OmpF porin, OOP family|tara:strand:- start:327 stop:1451 length:1125 start_codon:yes stop_codon:yes gene_type:complete
MKKILITSALCASFMFAASAPSSEYSYELTPFAAGILSDSKANLDDDHYANAGISLAKNLQNSFLDQVELAIMRSDSLKYEGSNGNTNINRVFLNAVKKLPLTEKLAAYGLLGAGYQDVTQEMKDNDDSALLNYGLGLRYDLPYYGIAVKGDVRHLFSINDKENDIMYTLGLAMPLGKKYSENIAAKVPVIAEPIAPIVPVVDGDDDNDGVLNSKDLCPNSLPGAVVNENGCEADDDKDGVVNRLDKCPNTSEGVAVNAEGCVATINLNINFDTNSDKIKSAYINKLEEFAAMLNENPKLNATIEAHTDSKGSSQYNQKLSEKRAASAVKALESLNIAPNRLQSIGYGETQPISTNDTAQGRAENRRVTGLINQ